MTCSECHIDQPPDAFYSRRDGARVNRCKECYRRKQRAYNARPEVKAKARAARREKRQQPGALAAERETRRRYLADPLTRQQYNERQRAYYRNRYRSDPKFRAQQLAKQRNRYARGGRGYRRHRWALADAQVQATGFTFCVLCQRRMPPDVLTVDHIVPCHDGGTDEVENLQLACGPCNTRKQARSMEQAIEYTVAALGPVQGVLS